MNLNNRNIPLLLLQTREAMMNYFRPALNKYQLTEQQWRIIRSLYDKKQLEPRELCIECCILSPSMAGILKRMEELKLIIKVPSDVDKRRVMVMLANGVDKIVEAVLAENKLAYENLAKMVGEESLLNLIQQLDNILKELN